MRRTLGIAGVVLVLAALAASRLDATPASDLLVGSGSGEGQAAEVLDERFGEEPIVVALEADLRSIMAPQALVGLLRLEGEIGALEGVAAVYGPATFVNQTIIQFERLVERELGGAAEKAKAAADGARREALRRGRSRERADKIAEETREIALGVKASEYKELLVRIGAVGAPSLTNPEFTGALVFGGGVEPKERFRWLFPDAQHATILVRPQGGHGEDETLALGDRIRDLVEEAQLHGIDTKVAGYPLLAAELERETRAELIRLAPVAIVAMLLLLLISLRRRRGRFVSLGLAVAGSLVAVGLSWPLGLGLSVATVAALPVILGLGLDFAVQLQARYWHERHGGRRAIDAARAARDAVSRTLILAAGAMSVAFLTLVLTDVPLLDRLGIVLALGTVCVLAAALLVGPALLVALDRGPVRPLALDRRVPLLRWTPRPVVLAVAAGLAAGGLAVSGETHLQTDLPELAPAGMSELEATEQLQEALGTSGQVRIAIEGPDVTDPQVVRWLADARARILEEMPALRSGPALSDLVIANGDPAAVDRAAVDRILELLPRYFVDAVLARDRTVAELSFGVPLVPVVQQQEIVGRIRDELREPPRGVEVHVAGLIAAAASSAQDLEGARPDLLLIATALVAFILFAFWRDAARVAIVLAPAVLAAGLAALVLAIVGLDLSPLGAALEPLVLAVGLEFGMLLDMRYREARAAGRSPSRAREESTREIGGAVALSAGTVAAGFAVLVASRLPLLSQLGWLVALELALCLLAALLVVPALSERRDVMRATPRRPRGPDPVTEPPAAGTSGHALSTAGGTPSS